MSDLKFSVVVPVYNGEELLSDCLAALCSQIGFQLNFDYEVVVVDDGSTDRTASVASQFPVRMIQLSQNAGRTIARETGVRTALAESLLLIDVKNVASRNLLKLRSEIPESLVMVGNLGEDLENKKWSMSRVFYLLRSWYYRPYYPQKKAVQEINSSNFFKVPKGFTAFFCTREEFLSALPDEKGKNINDDSKLMHHMVFQQGKVIQRRIDLAVKYRQSENAHSVIPWLVHRGVMFVDFVLIKNRRYLIALVFSYVAVLALLVVFLKWPFGAFSSAGVAGCVSFLVLVGVLKRASDAGLLVLSLPLIAGAFWFGVQKGLVLRFFSSLSREGVATI